MEAESQEAPEEGELVLASIRDITAHGAYVTLDEYDEARGFLHRSEIATGWVRNIERFIRAGQKSVLKVIRLNTSRREIDLSLRQVTGEEKKQKLIAVKQDEKARTIIDVVMSRLKIGYQESEKYRDIILSKYDTIYAAAIDVIEKGDKPLLKLNLPEAYASAFKSVSGEKITIPRVMVKGTLNLTSNLPNGVEVIKEGLTRAEKLDMGKTTVKIGYLGAPRYSILVEADNYKEGEKALQAAVEEIEDFMSPKKGHVTFSRGHTRGRSSG